MHERPNYVVKYCNYVGVSLEEFLNIHILCSALVLLSDLVRDEGDPREEESIKKRLV